MSKAFAGSVNTNDSITLIWFDIDKLREMSESKRRFIVAHEMEHLLAQCRHKNLTMAEIVKDLAINPILKKENEDA